MPEGPSDIETECPYCGYKIDDATGIGHNDNERPTPGAISICIRCATIGVYFMQDNGRLGIRVPTPEEQDECEADESIVRARMIVRTIQAFGTGRQ